MIDVSLLTKALQEQFPIITKILKEETKASILIGGVVRDFFLTHKIGKDLDFEIHIESLKDFDKFKSKVNEHYSINELNYNIFTTNINGFELEFTLPRIEEYDGSFGHSNFKAHYYPNLPLDKSFSRRDLTINAIGINIKTNEVLDPYDGLKDLNNKIVKNIDLNFIKDPVRFLRGIRFKTNLDFHFDQNLIKLYQNEKLEGLNPFHFFKELEKAHNKQFFIADIIKYLSTAFLTSYLYKLPDQELTLNQIKLWFYLKTKNKDYIKWSGLSLKNFSRALEVYEGAGDISKLPDNLRVDLSRIIAVDKMSGNS